MLLHLFVIFQLLISPTVMVLDTDWGDIYREIGELFIGDNETTGIFGGDNAVLGLFIITIIFIITFMLGITGIISIVIIIPTLFAVFNWIPELRLIVAIIAALAFGFVMNKIVKR